MSLQTLNAEKRQFSRIAFDAPVILQSGNKIWRSKLLDISLKGALIITPDNWENTDDTDFNFSIQLDECDYEIEMKVKLAHSEKKQIGFHCVHIDLDSVSNLKRLVELNLGDEDLLKRELSHMLE